MHCASAQHAWGGWGGGAEQVGERGRFLFCAHVWSVSVAVTLPATIMTSSVPTTVGGHMMYPSPHAVMYAPTSGLADGGLAVLNAFPQAPSAMQVSHGQVQDQGKAAVQASAP